MRANYQVNVTPQFRVLSDDQVEEIFHSALDVLERVGTRVYGEEGLALLRDAGCLVSDGDLVRIPSWLVKHALNTTPERIVVAGRDRRRRIVLEKDKIYFGTGSDCPSLIDPYTDEVRKYTYQDVYDAARISDALPHISPSSSPQSTKRGWPISITWPARRWAGRRSSPALPCSSSTSNPAPR